MTPEVVDTNVVRSVAEGDFDPTVVKRLRGRSTDLHLSPITILEIARHVRTAKAENLPRYQKALAFARELCGDRILPLPHILARKILFGDDLPSDPPEFFAWWCDAIINASSMEELAESEVVELDGEHYKLSLKLEQAEYLLKGIETRWADDAERASQEVLSSLSGVRSDRSSGRLVVRGKDEKQRARDVLRGEPMKIFIGKALLLRLSQTPDEMRSAIADDDLVSRVTEKFDLYIRYYLSVVEDRLTQRSGYNFEKRCHDRLDLEFLLYTGAGYGVVSVDGALLHRAGELGAGVCVRDPRSEEPT